MKKLAIILILTVLSVFVTAQAPLEKKELPDKTVVDKVSLRCYYLFSKKKENAQSAYRTDTMILDVGQKISKFYDPARLVRDSLVNARIKNMDPSTIKSVSVYKAEKAVGVADMPGTIGSNTNEGESCQIIKSKSSKTVTVLDYRQAIGDRFKFKDEIGPLKWEIRNEKDTLLSYSCQLATLRFRGRNYKAWFTTDIPVSDGPWKFSGLPGLILKVEDDKGLFAFKLIGLEQPANVLPIHVDDSKSIKCTRADFEKLKKKQDSGMQINVNAGNVIIAEIPGKYEYAAMELE